MGQDAEAAKASLFCPPTMAPEALHGALAQESIATGAEQGHIALGFCMAPTAPARAAKRLSQPHQDLLEDSRCWRGW